MIKLTIPNTLPTMNEIIDAAKQHAMSYREMKRIHTDAVAWSAKAERIPFVEKANFTITWICSDKRHDKDNIMAGQKFIFDGLVVAGVLKDDRWKQIGDVTHRFEIDRENPRIEITIEEVKV